jgi:hypothetical protein
MSVYIGESYIKEYDIRVEVRALLERGSTGLRDNDVMPSHLQEHRHRLSRGRVIVNDKNFV